MCERDSKMLGIGSCSRQVSEEVAAVDVKVREVDVAIIGNGPAGICLSLLLSGHLPYFTGLHPNPYLTDKLNKHPNRSLLDQDLEYLSEGLEGRSLNPVSLLLDTLLQPDTDLGGSHPSALSWEHSSSRSISHVVLGSGRPGGLWQEMQPDVKTLSLGSWLELPIYSFSEWERDQHRPQQTCLTSDAQHRGTRKRVKLGDVAQYYTDYVTSMRLGDSFLNGMTVTQVCDLEPKVCRVRTFSSNSDSSTSSVDRGESSFNDPIATGSIPSSSPAQFFTNSVRTSVASPLHLSAPNVRESSVASGLCFSSVSSLPDSRETSPTTSCLSDSDDNGVFCCLGKRSRYRWCIRATATNQTVGGEEEVIVQARNLVLACGVGGNPRRLGVPGEDLPFVRHTFWELPSQLAGLDCEQPLLVVGAGLSAMDAIVLALSQGIKVVHVFYSDASSAVQAYRQLSPDLYPEYCNVFDLMQGKASSSQYVPLPKCHVTGFRPERVCAVQSEEGHERTVAVSAVQVLIGSEAKLDFLSESVRKKLGVYPDQPIHAKKNPVDVDPYTFECTNVPSLFAVGPLAGDNFVRFVLGGTLGVSHCLHQRL